MRKIALLVVPLSITVVSAAELVCQGEKPRNPANRLITVDCTSHKAVIGALELAKAAMLREGGSAAQSVKPCSDAIESARALDPRKNSDLYPGFKISNRAPTFLRQCNVGMRYIK